MDTLPLSDSAIQPSSHLRACTFDREGSAAVQQEALFSQQPPENGFLWFDLANPSAADLERLQERFGLHPLAIEDALHAHQRAKAESYPGFEFVVVHSVARTDGARMEVHELNLFVGERFVISVRHGHHVPLKVILERWARVPEIWRADPSSLFYVLLDAMIDEYAPFTDALEDELRAVRHQLISQHHDQQQIKHIFQLSELAYAAHGVVFPLKDVMTTLLRAGPPVVSEHEVPYFRDIRDHVEHAIERLTFAQSMADRAFDVAHSLEARAQGAVSRQLTQVATVFLPLTLATGFFGQNFGYLVNHLLVSPQIFWIFCVGGEVLIAAVTLLYVQRIGRR